MRVIVQGAGVIGRPTGRILKEAGHIVDYHDPDQGMFAEGPCDVLVVCTPCREGFLPELVGDPRVTVVRSTVLPQAFDDLPVGKRHHWPEFLTERSADQDAMYPDKLVWGSDLPREEAADFARRLLVNHYQAAPVLHVSLRASCLIKLGINTHYTAKVMLANALWDAVDGDAEDYNAVCMGLAMDQRISLSHHRIMQDGFRGAGGKCLPKDSRLLSRLLEKHTTGTFLRAMCDANDRLRAGDW